ncbi:Ankyrin repeat-containing domain protein [Lactarius tabidus]
MRRLFDQSRPYFSAWRELYDIDIQVNVWRLYAEKHANSPLYYASLCGFRDLAEYLVKNSQDVNTMGGQHHSPLAAALHNRHTHVAELLYQHGADIELAGYNNRTLLVDGHVDAVRWLLEHGAKVNFRRQTDSPSRASFPDGVAFLSNFDGIVNAAMDQAGSPLHLASLHDHFNVMQLLIQRGADITLRDNLNSTPLHLAALRGGTDSVKLLIEHGADVNAQNKENSTPLHLALHMDNSDAVMGLWVARARTVEILIQHGADVHARDENNSTPLHLASSCGRAKAMQLLIQHGADVTALDKNDSTPLHLASKSRGVPGLIEQFESIQVLIQHGAYVNARDKRMSTPLHLLASPRWKRGTNHVRLLLEHGADVNATDVNGRTPDNIALSTARSRSASTEIARLIQDYRERAR